MQIDSAFDPMRMYRAKRDESHVYVKSKYNILGFISSGTYGRVYKAEDASGSLLAIKKFKPDKEGDVVTYTGISQSAIREIAVCHSAIWFFLYLTLPAQQRNQPRKHRLAHRSHPRRQINLYGL